LNRRWRICNPLPASEKQGKADDQQQWHQQSESLDLQPVEILHSLLDRLVARFEQADQSKQLEILQALEFIATEAAGVDSGRTLPTKRLPSRKSDPNPA